MHKILTFLLIIFVTFGLLAEEANAKRFGGGRSFGVSRSASSFTRSSPSPASTPTQQRSTASKWLGPLAGFAAGGLLASLFMGHGGMGGIFTWIILGIAAMFIWNLFRRGFSKPIPAQAQYNSGNAFDNVSYFNQSETSPSSALNYPTGFDAPVFLREAKVLFIRLQAAYDSKNLHDLREFTAPEVYAEVQLQFQERGNVVNQTEVISLDVQLLDVLHEPQGLLASVQFSGVIREDLGQPSSFVETWHFRKEDGSMKWVVAGIQQSV